MPQKVVVFALKYVVNLVEFRIVLIFDVLPSTPTPVNKAQGSIFMLNLFTLIRLNGYLFSLFNWFYKDSQKNYRMSHIFTSRNPHYLLKYKNIRFSHSTSALALILVANIFTHSEQYRTNHV